MPPADSPVFAELPAEDCAALLARNNVGRLAFTFGDHVDIEPIHYVFREGRVFFRTAPGSKLTALLHHPWVALEVDEIEGLFDWKSVVVHGTVYLLTDTATEEERKAHAEALRALRALVPGTFAGDDPVPFRDVVVEMTVNRVSGRAARSA